MLNVEALVTPAEVVAALRDVVDWGEGIHLAYAWASSAEGLPANLASMDKIEAVFGERPSTVNKYLAIIKQIWSYPWSNAPVPDDPTEQRLWRARVALLDAIFYEPKST